MLAELKNDLLYLLNILESIEKIHIYSRKVDTAEDFFYANDQLNFNATLNLLANIGENCSKISSELKNKNPDIQWQDIKNFRNRIAHDYVGIDMFIVFRIIQNELEPLKKRIFLLIAEELKNKNFDEKEFQLARESYYYRHIPFNEIVS
ncbi:MAG TPA: HepT-like ribonuclease domain-containing protein [Candidatus Deferrimicrobium sp.]|nr:HepT-like ribonuclease domain-containing protein [Candidatus Kapabacteria bacterium]HLP57727.1 HepT-like ribonuclease domain-containing protein [Candidatus Deferrimicrobium sp.]